MCNRPEGCAGDKTVRRSDAVLAHTGLPVWLGVDRLQAKGDTQLL